MPCKCIFWDNDGVLVDTEELYFQASAETLAGVGIPLSRARFTHISLTEGESVFTLAGDTLSAERRRELREARNRRYAELLETEVRICPGIPEVLRALQGRVRMAIVTSSLRRHFDLIHRDSNLLPYFDFVLTREDYGLSKPHPEPYLSALARSGLSPQECLVIEDSPRGIASAKAAGLRCFAIPGSLTRTEDLAEADALLSDIRDLADLPLFFSASNFSP